MIKDYWTYIKESSEIKFEIGDEVIVNGYVDDQEFSNQPDRIDDISQDKVDTNMCETGECEIYNYKGITYHLSEAQWWVSPYNLKLANYRREISEKDPYGEEHWDSENEAKKAEDKALVGMDGNILTGWNYAIDVLLNQNMNEENRTRVLDMINRNIKGGKKVQFYNLKQGKNLKKVRIATGAYWKENQDKRNVWERWVLMLIGTKKDYCVNKNRPIGYYTDVVRTISPIDPYGEEIWD